MKPIKINGRKLTPLYRDLHEMLNTMVNENQTFIDKIDHTRELLGELTDDHRRLAEEFKALTGESLPTTPDEVNLFRSRLNTSRFQK